MKKLNPFILVLIICSSLTAQIVDTQTFVKTASLNEESLINSNLKYANSNAFFKFDPYLTRFDNSIFPEQNYCFNHQQIINQFNVERKSNPEKTISILNNDLWEVDEEEVLQMENWMLNPDEWLSAN